MLDSWKIRLGDLLDVALLGDEMTIGQRKTLDDRLRWLMDDNWKIEGSSRAYDETNKRFQRIVRRVVVPMLRRTEVEYDLVTDLVDLVPLLGLSPDTVFVYGDTHFDYGNRWGDGSRLPTI